MIKVLFISHDSARAGAQILLLEFLQWLKQNHPEVEFDVLLGNSGELTNEFKSITTTFIWKKHFLYSKNPVHHLKIRCQFQKLKKEKYDLIFSNTVINGFILNELKELKIPIITHIHELKFWINKSGEENYQIVFQNSNKIIAASKAVENCLLAEYSVSQNKILTIYEHINFEKISNENRKLNLHKKLELSQDSIIIGASGFEIWRKGKDWFIPLAIDVINRNPEKEIHFVWIGGKLTYELEHDYKSISCKDKIHFIPHLPDANRYFSDFYAFAMLSREDPFPIVNLEAAANGVPVICFNNAGGTPELTALGCGYSVQYGNLNEFASKICQLINSPIERSSIGQQAKKVVKENFDINDIGKKILDVIVSLYEKN